MKFKTNKSDKEIQLWSDAFAFDLENAANEGNLLNIYSSMYKKYGKFQQS